MRDFFTMAFIVIILYAIYSMFFADKLSLPGSEPKANSTSLTKSSKPVSMPAVEIGTDFKLTNQYGEVMSSKQLRKRKLLVFFGFTNCPDICPAALAVMNEAYGLLGADSSLIKPVFITVDPENDTPQVIQEYLLNFSPDFLGFTGDRAEIERVVKAYKAYTNKSDDGQVMHSDLIYLMDGNGKYITHFNRDNTPQEIAKTIKKHR
jgi:protein SCO1/2